MFLRANKVPNEINKWIIKRLIKKQTYWNKVKNGTYRYLRKLMALPFAPAECIPAVFDHLRQNATTPALHKVDYIKNRWISSDVWPNQKQRKVYNELQGKIFGSWEDFRVGRITALQLVKSCSLHSDSVVHWGPAKVRTETEVIRM